MNGCQHAVEEFFVRRCAAKMKWIPLKLSGIEARSAKQR